MFKFVDMVKTKDGKLFDDEDKAEKYIVDKISEEINDWIKKTETFDLRHRDLIKIMFELNKSVIVNVAEVNSKMVN